MRQASRLAWVADACPGFPGPVGESPYHRGRRGGEDVLARGKCQKQLVGPREVSRALDDGVSGFRVVSRPGPGPLDGLFDSGEPYLDAQARSFFLLPVRPAHPNACLVSLGARGAGKDHCCLIPEADNERGGIACTPGKKRDRPGGHALSHGNTGEQAHGVLGCLELDVQEDLHRAGRHHVPAPRDDDARRSQPVSCPPPCRKGRTP